LDFDAYFFDFDGTLVDSEPLHYACWREILAPFGIELSWADYERTCIGVSDRAMVAQLAAAAGVNFDELYAQYPRKKEMLRERILDDPPMPSATRAQLDRDFSVPLAVVSSSYRLEVEPVLEELGLGARFAAKVFGDEVQNLKPHPEPYLEAARRLAVRNPLVFEDSEAGVASAKAAGFQVVRVASADELAELLARL
jgi:beta-phosphoglucomutase-like phosphatase (HAD superfamily)